MRHLQIAHDETGRVKESRTALFNMCYHKRFGAALLGLGVLFYFLLTTWPGKNRLPDSVEVLIPGILKEEDGECNDASFVKGFFPDKYWERYQFTDYFKGIGPASPWENYPGSFMDQYHETGKDPGDIDLLYDLVSKRKHASNNSSLDTSSPNSAKTIVIHLRLGDVIDAARDSVHDLLSEQKYFYNQNENGECCIEPWNRPNTPPLVVDWNAYVRPLSYYSRFMNDLQEYTSIVIMGSAHMGQIPEGDDIENVGERGAKSCQYTLALRAYLDRKNPQANVTLRLGQSPDDDMVFASHAGAYVQAGGGFSNLLGQLVAKTGGRVFK